MNANRVRGLWFALRLAGCVPVELDKEQLNAPSPIKLTDTEVQLIARGCGECTARLELEKALWRG